MGHRVVASSGAGPSGFVDGHDLSEIMTILGGRAVRMFLPFFETDAADDTPVQDAGPRGHHFLKHNTSDYDPYIKGHVLAYRLNGLASPNGEAFDMADHDDFSFGDGAEDSPFSVGIAARFYNTSANALVGRSDETALAEKREYLLFTGGGVFSTIEFLVFDETTAAFIGRTTPNNIIVNDRWYIFIGTYDGGYASEGVRIYLDGVRVDSLDRINGVYTAMHNTAVATTVGYMTGGGGVRIYFLKGDCWGPFITGKCLSAGEVLSLTNLYRKVLCL